MPPSSRPTWWNVGRDSRWWAGVLLTLVGFLFAILVRAAREEDGVFHTTGMRAMATVIGKDTQTEFLHNILTTKYTLRYTYDAAGRAHWLGWGEVPYDRWERIDVGDIVRIEYLPENPARSRLAESADIDSREAWWWAAVLMAFLLGVSGCLLSAYALIRVARQAQVCMNQPDPK
jgi:hypothetical protein